MRGWHPGSMYVSYGRDHDRGRGRDPVDRFHEYDATANSVSFKPFDGAQSLHSGTCVAVVF